MNIVTSHGFFFVFDRIEEDDSKQKLKYNENPSSLQNLKVTSKDYSSTSHYSTYQFQHFYQCLQD